MIGTMFVSVEEGGDPKSGLTRGELTAAVIMLVGGYFLITNLLPAEWVMGDATYTAMGVFYASLIGLLCGLGIGFVTEYYTGFNKAPVREISRQSAKGGAATNIISGLGVGMRSTMLPILFLAAAILGAYHFAGCTASQLPPWVCWPTPASNSPWTPTALWPTTPAASPK